MELVLNEAGRNGMRPGSVVQGAIRLVTFALALGAVTALYLRVFHVNSATAGFTFLVLILALATRVSLGQSIAASILSVAAYNFFFLPPVGTFTIADPQNWVALLAFLATAITASHLSSSARRRAQESRARQAELQRMYDFSRGLMLGDDESGLAQKLVKQVVESFQLRNAWFYDSVTDRIVKFQESDDDFDETTLIETAAGSSAWRDSTGAVLVTPVRLGGVGLGSLAITGETIPSEVALDAIGQLIAIAIERARVQEVSAHIEATRQNEQLKSTLLDALAHEFKTPLTSVKAATTTLLSSPLNAFDQKELLTIVDEEADRMNGLVSDAIELVRLGTAPITLNRERCSVDELISSALNAMRRLLEGRELKLDLGSGTPSVLVDPNLTELALRQILNNAAKYSPNTSEVRLRTESDDQFVVLSISNFGPPIRKAEQAKIFEKFYRGPEVRTRIPGTGMGLSITREIIEAQGGTVLVQSEPGMGTTFSITLPIDKLSEHGAELQESA